MFGEESLADAFTLVLKEWQKPKQPLKLLFKSNNTQDFSGFHSKCDGHFRG